MKKLFLATVSAGILAACTKPAVWIEDAWIRTPPPGMNMTAAYFVLHNATDTTISLVGATSDAFDNVSIHESRVVDGISEMIRMRSLSVAAGDRVVFKPGGLHIMMRNPVRTLEPGEQATISLDLADGRQLSTLAIVTDSAP